MTAGQWLAISLSILAAWMLWAAITSGRRYLHDLQMWTSENLSPALPAGDRVQHLPDVPAVPAGYGSELGAAGHAGRAGRCVAAGRLVVDRPMSKGPGR